MKILETLRLVLRWLTPQDAPFLLQLLTDPAFLENIGDRGVRDLEGARHYIETGPRASYRQHGHGLYLTELKETATPIGICGLLRRDSLEDVDLGFALLPEFRGQGYASEAAAASLDHGRSVLGFQRVVAIVAPHNLGSIRVLEKLGFNFESMIQVPGEDEEIQLFAWNA